MMRDRLIELLDEAMDKKGIYLAMDKKGIYLKEIADYLLENGVIVPPFKIDDIVYGISRGQIIPIQIDTIQYTKRGIDVYGSNEEYFGYSTIHLDINNQIGIQWYKTKEEAKKVLEAENENHNRNT